MVSSRIFGNVFPWAHFDLGQVGTVRDRCVSNGAGYRVRMGGVTVTRQKAESPGIIRVRHNNNNGRHGSSVMAVAFYWTITGRQTGKASSAGTGHTRKIEKTEPSNQQV